MSGLWMASEGGTMVPEGQVMPQIQYTTEQIGRRGQEIYERDIRPKVMPQHKGKFLVLDIETGQYEIDADDSQAEERLKARVPGAVMCGVRIGYTSAYTLGGRMVEESP
jgi:hypothetical protein